MKAYSLVLLSLLLVRCGRPAPNVERTNAVLRIQPQLPASITSRASRMVLLKERSCWAHVYMESREGERWTRKLGPVLWETFSVSDFNFPKSANDVVTLRIRVLGCPASAKPLTDKPSSGLGKTLLQGKVRVAASELGDGPSDVIPLKLNLMVGISYFDRP